MNKNGLLIVVSGPSGTGKGTLCKQLLARNPNISYSVSATTRSPRAGEIEGANYYFLSKQKFQQMIEHEEFLEWAEVYGNYYGTPLKKIQEKLASGEDVLLEIDTQGAMKVMQKFPEAVYIYILPPSLQELEQRIRRRGSETEDSILRRLHAAKSEIRTGEHYKYVVVNDAVRSAVGKMTAIIVAEHCRMEKNTSLLNRLEHAEER
jgi:guanylate kinase